MKFIGYCRRHALRIGISLMMVVLLLLNAKGVFQLNFMERLENYTYDLRLLANMPGGVDPRIVIVDIDEKSLQEQGHWPWPRNRLTQLVDLLFDRYKIDVLGFDIVFAERDESSGLKQMESLARSELAADAGFKSALSRLKPQLDYDQLFADSLKNRRVVLGYYFLDVQAEKIGGQTPANGVPALPGGASHTLPAPALTRERFDPGKVGAVVAGGFKGNLPELQSSAAAGGYFSSPLIDTVGVFRRQPLLKMHNGQLYEALSLAVARLALRETTVALEYVQGDTSELGVEYLKVEKKWIPVDQHVAA
jgi:adenylate cyclase